MTNHTLVIHLFPDSPDVALTPDQIALLEEIQSRLQIRHPDVQIKISRHKYDPANTVKIYSVDDLLAEASDIALNLERIG